MIYRSCPAPGSTISRTYSKSYYETLRSDFIHIFWNLQFDPPTSFKNKFSQLMAVMKLTAAKEMKDWGMTFEEGKSPMGFLIFKRLCQLMT